MAEPESKDKKVKKEKFKWKRIGKCKQCGICCMITKHTRSYNKKYAKDNKRHIEFDKIIGLNKIYENKKTIVYADIDACPHLEIKGTKFICGIHGKKPKVCRTYPSIPHDYYRYLKKFCGYRFKKVRI